MMWGYGWGWPAMLWMGLGGIFWLVVLGLLIWALVYGLSRRAPASSLLPGHGPTALETLQQRYARGEIDVATYEQMRERLQSSQAPRTAVIEYESPNDTRS